MNLNGEIYHQTNAKAAPPERGVLGALFAWLWLWLCHDRVAATSSEYEEAERQYRAVYNYPWNRKQRRMARCRHKIPANRVPGGFDRIISRGLTSTQRLERLARMSINGRVRVYKFRYQARQRRALTHRFTSLIKSASWLGLTSKHCHPRLDRGP